MNEKVRATHDWQQHSAAIVIFLVWLELMMLVGRFPIFGLYVQMFTKVNTFFCDSFDRNIFCNHNSLNYPHSSSRWPSTLPSS